ncbi:DUF3383 domain-containing protein [Desemzia sp. C1]|uniref:DUF3383 family protein n=1 Tax=Desemzia sp. C1 TaxID=2892016 RepID=UPI001E60783C|nr:DUF3383 family protein [Desemzia sp. C1]MCI3027688.1 DUF3383 domain-containing protein [Desemzia sp. C1]
MAQPISDVTVKITVQTPASVVGLGNPAIFVKGTTAGMKSYSDLEGLAADYAVGTGVYNKAKTIFAQLNKPAKVLVVTYAEGAVAAAADNAFYEDWHFALLAEYNETDALALSNFVEEQNYKFVVLQVEMAEELLPYENNSLTIGLVHSKPAEALDAALVGDAANATVGSITWKFRQNLAGITPDNINRTELDAIHAAGGIAYVSKAGVSQTSEGKTVGGEFIDAIHGEHWVKATIESRVQSLLANTDKLSFDANGIALLDAELTTVLQQAFINGIVDMVDESGEPDFAVVALQRADLDPADIAARNYKGLSFTYRRSGAIHSVAVTGTVEV